MDGTDGARGTGPTMAAVAREAGVSVPTVSKVVNGRLGVAPETRRRVALAARRLGYARPTAPDPVARRPLVELVTGGLDRPGTAAVLQAVERAASGRGFGLLVSVVPPPERWRDATPDWLPQPRRRPAGGLLFHVRGLPPRVYGRLLEHGTRFVMVDPETAPPDEVPWVATANRLAGAQAADHLLALGHRRIAVLTGPDGSPADRARVAGLRARLAGAGVAVPNALVRPGEPGRGSARRAVGELLARIDGRPTAVFVSSDTLAAAVLLEAAARGVRVPDELSVVAFGEPSPDWACAPALTTVCRPVAELAAEALALLLDGAVRAQQGPHWVELPPVLRLGSSTSPPAEAHLGEAARR
ncbi:LacI family DNA-binding transcriptional regulator [Streptomyces sp. 3MP-14]|uniref:LacI family DNA-binding transcriptional regulator n=1 Tax=Streptomyces mimosae TaxID=2586635 RepID=A0A5N6A1N8_9ACTN|nr:MULTISPECIES: LacI family DNA-binding transcriptional regulator [Streptomyces]KAB8161909.1 LacI family DNA-binding transcriptional regulator [Streptomyces mimosae]KAB8173607.1 LacI family DNA-binding transcriptional regulator [Streptomyces sp. 3MP-14]